ncbi:MAG TPA: hypothetical protein VEJ63_06365, partial [Planctomycetota bacterium]|nr:hypothetical protein [Planctomycetota bacterium]
VLAALILALSGPTLARGSSGRSAFVLMIDNGAQSRASIGGTPGIALVRERVRRLLANASSATDVILCRSAPIPTLVSNEPLSIAQALGELERIEPCISASSVDTAWLFASDQARVRGGETSLPFLVVSLQNGPSGAGARWLCAAPAKIALQNAGVVAFGSAQVEADRGSEIQLLARVKNFSAKETRGALTLTRTGSTDPLGKRELAVPAGSEATATFSISEAEVSALRLEWKSASGADAFADDDVVIAAPQRSSKISVRFHAPLPAVEKLYRSIRAEVLMREDARPADLEIYVQRLPEQVPDGAKAILLIAPPSGYRSIFDVGGVIEAPLPQRDEDDSLTRAIGDKPESSFSAGRSVEILRIGDFRSLLKDQKSGRTLAARFQDNKRTGYLLAFVPGAGMPLERKLDPPLAALLVRMAREAAGLGDPFAAESLSAFEANAGRAMPHDWAALPDVLKLGGGVLDEKVSALPLGTPSEADAAATSALAAGERRADLAPWLGLLALALIVAELWLQGGGARSGPAAPVQLAPGSAVKK